MYDKTAQVINGIKVYSFQNPIFEGLPSDDNADGRLNTVSKHTIPTIQIKW